MEVGPEVDTKVAHEASPQLNRPGPGLALLLVDGVLRALYSLVLTLLLPAMALRLWLRSRRSPGYALHWGQRFWGLLPKAPFWRAHPKRLWVHAVSVGETRAIAPLVRAWLAEGPEDRAVLLTQTTPTGRAAAEAVFADLIADHRLLLSYLPYDLPWSLHWFMAQSRPAALVLVETELWPNLLRVAQQWALPVALINARLSARSLRGYQRAAWLARPALSRMTLVLAQTEADGQRLQQAGFLGQPQVLGSLKFDQPAAPALMALGRAWRRQLSVSRVWMLASSREGEEALVLSAWRQLAPANTLLLLVPRHPERFDAVASLAQAQGFRVLRRSRDLQSGPQPDPLDQTPSAPTAQPVCLIGDSMGEVPAYVAAADLVMIGGSLLPLGGQNPLEAAAQGRPVLMGPDMTNFQQISEGLLACGAAAQAGTPEALLALAQRISDQPERAEAMGRAGLAYAQAHQGATDRTLAALQTLSLSGRRPASAR